MDLGYKNANDLISKNAEVSKAAAAKIVDTKDIQSFKALCEKSDFLFDFIKEKIIKNLIGAVRGENLANLFEFTKIYNADFEDFIVKSFVKFANEDLTDEILNLFEIGTNEQKAYAAAYFAKINDPLAIEYLEKFAFDDFEPLSQNCALALSAFKEKNLFNKALCVLKDKNVDDFEKCKYINFLSTYGTDEAYEAIYDVFKTSLIKSYAATNILYLKNFKTLIQEGKAGEACELFDTLIEAYPEEIPLETVFNFEVSSFVNYLKNEILEENSPYLNRLLLKAKEKFNLISENDIYTFDLDKDTKREIKEISNGINVFDADLFENLEEEFHQSKERALETLNVILNYGKVEFSDEIIKLIDETTEEELVSEGIKVLKALNRLQNVDKDKVLAKIKNENIRVLTNSYFA